MIGTNVPGIAIPFKQYGFGVVIEDESTDSIKKAIEYIEDNYEAMKEACTRFYNDNDYDEIVKKILADTE